MTPGQPEPMGALRDLCMHLEKFDAVTRDFLAAVAAQDNTAALRAVHESRPVRAAVAHAREQVYSTQFAANSDTINLMARMWVLLQSCTLGESAFDRWHKRPLPDDDELLKAPNGATYLADAILPPAWNYETDLTIFVGCDFAAVARELHRIGQKRIVFYLPTQNDDRTIPKQSISVHTIDELASAVRTMQPRAPTRVVIRCASSAGSTEQVKTIGDRVHEVVSDLRVFRNTVNVFGKIWVEQAIENLPTVAAWPSIATIGDRLEGKPMIICAPGPSLSKNIELVKELQDKAIVVGFSHSMTALTAAGVSPDFVVTVDPQDLLYHFDNCDLNTIGTFVNAVTVHPKLYQFEGARFLSMAANSMLDQWIFRDLGEDACAVGGGSVATTALSVATRWQCDPVIFVGLDLSFPNGQYYVSTSCDGEARAVVSEDGKTMHVAGWSSGFHAMKAAGGPKAARERLVELPGYHGGTVPSSFMFSMFHRWFENAADTLSGRMRIINCTQGGAYIEGMEHITLQEAADRFLTEPIDVDAVMNDTLSSLCPLSRRTVLRRQLANMISATDRCITLAKRCQRLAIPARERELARAEAQLSESIQSALFLSIVAQDDIETALHSATTSRTVEDALSASKSLFATIVERGEWLRPKLSAAYHELLTVATSGGLSLRVATAKDSKLVWSWNTASSVRAVSKSTAPIPYKRHKRWYRRKLSSNSGAMWIATFEGEPIGVVRFDPKGHDAEVSIALDTQHRGRGLGARALTLACATYGRTHNGTTIIASIRADNAVSRSCFEGVGFALDDSAHDAGTAWLTYRLENPS